MSTTQTKHRLAAVLLSLLILPSHLHAGNFTLVTSATATTTAVQNSTVSASNSTQVVIATNVTAQILHINDTGTGSGSTVGHLMIQVNGLNFRYTETDLKDPNNRPTIVGPATITLTAYVSIISQGNVVTGQNNMLCTISTNQVSQSDTGQFTPNTGVVIPADSSGPVNIILESSVDLINWIPANPGTYGTTTTNRFFRVRATR